MRYRYLIIRVVLSCFVFLSLSTSLKAQDYFFEQSDLCTIQNPYLLTNNAASLSLFNRDVYVDISTDFLRSWGDYKSSRQAKSNNTYAFRALAISRIDGFTYRGVISYKEVYSNSKRWNHRMDQTSNNPYIVGDSIKGDFKKDVFSIQTAISHSIFSDQLDAGLGITYLAGMGAKTKDPRPKNIDMNVDIAPSLLYKWGTSSVGLSYAMSFKKEKIETKKFADGQDKLFFFSGMGFVDIGDLSAAFVREYFEKAHSLSLQYQYENDALMHFLSAKIYSSDCDIEDSKDVIKPISSYNMQGVSVLYINNFNKNDISSSLSVNIKYEEAEGVVNILNKVATETYYIWERLATKDEYSSKELISNIDYRLEYKSWACIVMGDLELSKKEFAFFPELFSQSYSNLLTSCLLSKTFKISDNRLMLTAGFGIMNNLDKDSYFINQDLAREMNIDNLSSYYIEEVGKYDFDYDTAEYVNYSLKLKWFMPLVISNTPSDINISLKYNRIDSKDLSMRDVFSFNLALVM